MNRLCWDIEKFHKEYKWERYSIKNFDYTIMLNKNVEVDEETAIKMENIYLEYNREFAEWKKDETSIREQYKYTTETFELHWDLFYDKYRKLIIDSCGGNKVLAGNAVVKMVYEKYKDKAINYMWHMVGEYIVQNIEFDENAMFPKRDDNGEFEYLGKKYTLERRD
jgi:hypothetical protein